MKCYHSEVKSRDWTQCPDCRKTMRYIPPNRWIRYVLYVLFFGLGFNPLIEWLRAMLHWENQPLLKDLPAILVIVLFFYLLYWFFPNCREKRPSASKE